MFLMLSRLVPLCLMLCPFSLLCYLFLFIYYLFVYLRYWTRGQPYWRLRATQWSTPAVNILILLRLRYLPNFLTWIPDGNVSEWLNEMLCTLKIILNFCPLKCLLFKFQRAASGRNYYPMSGNSVCVLRRWWNNWQSNTARLELVQQVLW